MSKQTEDLDRPPRLSNGEPFGERNDGIARKAGYANWDEWCVELQEAKGRRICGALANHTLAPCRSWPIKDRHRCRVHGGKSVRGTAHPAWKNGSGSRYVPQDILGDFEEAYNDPEFLSLRREIAINSARQDELLRNLGTGESAPAWSDLALLTSHMVNAVTEDDQEKILQYSTRIHEAVDKGTKRTKLWDELEKAQKHGQRLKAAHSRIMVERGMTLDKDRVLALISWLVTMLREKIEDRKVLSEISSEIRRKIGVSDRVKDIRSVGR